MRTASITFSTAHLYNQKEWSDEKNLREFGACFTPYGHGHNYRLMVTFKDHTASAAALLKTLAAPYDHKHLNFDHAAFSGGALIPTTENIALDLYQNALKLSPEITGLRLYELENLWAECGSSLPSLIDQALPLQVRTAVRLPWPELYQADAISREALSADSFKHASMFANWSEFLVDWNTRFAPELGPLALESRAGEYYFVAPSQRSV